jgi:ADP-ribose pyrophosphatase YjhB (NUDIX family)
MKKLIPQDAALIPDNAECVFKGKIFDVYQWPQVLYDGSTATFERLKRPDATDVICIVNDKILIITDEQPDRGPLEAFPGGRVDPGEVSMTASAQREVLEEVGYSFKNWRLLQVGQPFKKIEWFSYLFIAWDVTGQQAPHNDAGERITIKEVSFEELKQLVLARTDYLDVAEDLFKNTNSIDELLKLPEYEGVEVDR